MRARGGVLTAKSIPSVGGLIEYLCWGDGTFDFFDRETGGEIKRSYMAASFLALKVQLSLEIKCERFIVSSIEHLL